jgi:phage protein D
MEGIDTYAPAFSVMVGGKKVTRESITALEIEEDLAGPGMCKISLSETSYGGIPSFRWLEDESLLPGSLVEIRYGYSGSKEQTGTFVGRVNALTPGFQSSGTPTIGIQGYDPSHGLQDTYGPPDYAKVTYSQVARQIGAGLKLDLKGIEDPKSKQAKKKHETVTRKKNESDYALLKRLAEKIGHEFFVSRGVLYFREPGDTKKGEIAFTYGRDIISFSPRLSPAMTVNEVVVTGWDEKSKKPIRATATIGDVKNSLGIQNLDRLIEKAHGKKATVKLEGEGIDSVDEAKEIAIRELKRRNNGFITGSLECIGNPDLEPGITIGIRNVGSSFSGDYYITKSRHAIGDGGYRTTLDVRRCV